jgi:protease II
VSPNHKMIAYAEDTKGDKIYNVYVIDAQNGELISSPLMGIADTTNLQCQAFRHAQKFADNNRE